MIDGRRYARNVTFNQANLVVAVVAGLIMSPFIVHQLGDAANGYWSLVVAITAYFGYFDLGIQSGVNHYITRHLAGNQPEQLNDKFNSALTVLLGIGALAVIGSLVLSRVLPAFFRVPPDAVAPFQAALLLIGIVTAFKFPFSAFQAVLVGAQRYDITSGTALSVRILSAVLVYYALTAEQHLMALAVVVAGTQILEGVVLMVMALRVVPVIRIRLLRFQWPAFRELLDYGFFNFIINVSAQFGAGFGAVAVGRFIDASAVTYYTISLDIIPYMGSVISALSMPLLQIMIPMDVRNDMQSLRAMFLTGSRYLVALTGLMGANLLLVGPAFLGQWMGPKYLEPEPYGSSGTVLIVLTLAAMFALCATVAQVVLLGRRRNKIYAAIIVAETVGIVTLSLALVPAWGMLGVAVAALVPAFVAQTIGLNAVAAYFAGTTLRRFFREALLPNLGVLLVVCVTGQALLPYVLAPGWGPILRSFTLVSVLYLVLSLVFVVDRAHFYTLARAAWQFWPAQRKRL